LLKRAIGIASEKRGARMRVNEGPAFVLLSKRKRRTENEGEKTAMRSVLAQSSSRERARAVKDPDVRSPQGGAQGSLKGCQGLSQEKGGCGAHRGKAFRVVEIVRASRCGR
jgi:hypothetical protein